MSTIAADVLESRLDHLRTALKDAQLDALALNPGPSLVYLSDLHFHLSERPVVLIIPADGVPSLVLPELEVQKAATAALNLDYFTYKEALETWSLAYQSCVDRAQINGKRVGVEPGCMRVLELRLLEAAAPDAQFVSGEQVVASLRMQKDESELGLMREAVKIAQNALLATLPRVAEGVSEREISGVLIQNMLAEGSEGELPFQPIIAFGPNSANPHAVPTDYKLKGGDLVLFDWGANYRGYFSDLTRMFSLGEPESELRNIVEIVRASNAAGREAVAAGRAAGDIDAACRGVIEDAGYGEFFMHRTGHGLGLEVHEAPYMRGDNQRTLQSGMTFTIEPGIYLNGRGGARIEDDMVVTDSGGESLSTISRELGILGT